MNTKLTILASLTALAFADQPTLSSLAELEPDCRLEVSGSCYAQVCQRSVQIGLSRDLESNSPLTTQDTVSINKLYNEKFNLIKTPFTSEATDDYTCIAFSLTDSDFMNDSPVRNYHYSPARGLQSLSSGNDSGFLQKFDSDEVNLVAFADDFLVFGNYDGSVLRVFDQLSQKILPVVI